MTADRLGDDIGTDPVAADRPHVRHVAVIVSRFPKFTETFVVNEILALERLGITVDVHPLLPMEPAPHQPVARPLVERAHFGSPWGRASLRSFLGRLARQPMTIGRIAVLLVRRTWRRPTVLVKDLVLLPRICAIADDLERDGVSHVHAHFATHAGFAAFCIGRLTGLPYSIVAHGSDVHRHQLMLAEKIREAAFVATVSDYNRRVLLSVSDPAAGERVEVIRVGVDLAGLDDLDVTTSAIDMPDTPLLLCVGTLHEVKGQQHLIRAVAEVVRRGRPVRLELIGDGTDRPALEQIITDLRLDDCVALVGSLPHASVLERYRSAAIVIAPSVPSRDGRKEGIPTVLIEAMALGANVLASDLAGISELVEHEVTGLLTPPGDAAAIADAIERLLDDPALARRLREAASARILDEYDLERTAARMSELMDRAAS